MTQDVAELIQEYLSNDPIKWAKLASDMNWRRLQLLLLREILIELRKLNNANANKKDTVGMDHSESKTVT